MKTFKCFLIFLLLFTGTLCFAQTKDTLKILFVGNSYTFVSNMPHIVSLISDSTKTKLITSKSTLGGSTLSNHWNGERGLKTKEIIKSGNFDIVVLQEFSMSTINNQDSFMLHAKKFCDYIKEHGAKPYFYETWAREKVPQWQKTITEMYHKAASENNAGLVKVGEARELALKLRPQLELYQADGSHPSDLGALLAACVFVQAFTNEIPDKLPSRFTIFDGYGQSLDLLDFIDQLDIRFFLEVVKEISEKEDF
tara:strand:+ start:83 stop:841 length:759 start_codon:yes stop_codon:yes gene_type:complete